MSLDDYKQEESNDSAAAASGIFDSSTEFQRESQAITMSDHDVKAENAKVEEE